jgi:hypothetical protein
MSKLGKLLVHPDLFFRDAIANRRIKAALARDTTSQRDTRRDDDLPFSQALMRRLRGTTNVFSTHSVHGDERLNCFEGDLPVFMHAALELAEARERTLHVLPKRQVIAVRRANLTATIHQLLEAESFELALEAAHPEIVASVAVWENRADGEAYCRGPNLFAKRLPRTVLDELLDPDTQVVDFSRLYECPVDTRCTFDVDVVYTWVDHTDERWREQLAHHRDLDEVAWERFMSHDELRYSLRSLHRFCPWVRHIFVLTNCRPPAWFKPHPKVSFVDHADVFPSPDDCLPTFNSHAIEANLMRIEGLSEQFIYMNDDVFIGLPCDKDSFFASNGMSISYLENYGMVHGEVADERPDYMNAALNGQRLIEEAFGVSATQLHAPAPHALRKSVLLEMEERFPGVFDSVRRARFRSATDVSIVSFLYHHYAFQKREALRTPATAMALIRPDNASESFVELLTRRVRRFFCINDASYDEPRFAAQVREVLETMYPGSAPWET